MGTASSKENYAFWQDTMERYEKSGLRIKEFCHQNNLNFYRFRNWRFLVKKKQNSESKREALANTFIPLVIKDTPVANDLPPTHTIELKLEPSGNVHICIPSQFNPESLSSLLAILKKVRC